MKIPRNILNANKKNENKKNKKIIIFVLKNLTYIFSRMSSFCLSGSCEGFLRVGFLVTTAGISAKRFCGLCVINCSDKICLFEEVVDQNVLKETGVRYLIEPRRWPSTTAARLKTEYQPADIDFGACAFIQERIAKMLAKHERKHTVSNKSLMSANGSSLMVEDTLHCLLPSGKSKENAICLDMPNCELCATPACHYKVQCDECSQFTCGSWIRLKGTCAYCRYHLSC